MREVGSDGDMAAPCFREKESAREISSSVWEAKLQRAQGGQASEGHGGQEVLKVEQVLLLNMWAVNQDSSLSCSRNKKSGLKRLNIMTHIRGGGPLFENHQP